MLVEATNTRVHVYLGNTNTGITGGPGDLLPSESKMHPAQPSLTRVQLVPRVTAVRKRVRARARELRG
eukprot:3640204-Rhodomonas_salina.1